MCKLTQWGNPFGMYMYIKSGIYFDIFCQLYRNKAEKNLKNINSDQIWLVLSHGFKNVILFFCGSEKIIL